MGMRRLAAMPCRERGRLRGLGRSRLEVVKAISRPVRMASSGRVNPLLRERGDVGSGRIALIQPLHTSRLAVVPVGFTLTRGPCRAGICSTNKERTMAHLALPDGIGLPVGD